MSATSATCAVPSKPAARMPSKTSSRLSALTSTPTTFAPPAAHFSEISLPKPLAAPVTIMTLSFKYFDIRLLPVPRVSCRSVGGDDRLELVWRGAVHDHRVRAVIKLLADAVHTLLSRSGGHASSHSPGINPAM